VDNTVGNQNIRSNNASAVDEDATAVDGDGQVGAVDRLEDSSVSETRAVAGRIANNSVVSEDTSDLVSGKVGKTTGNGLESRIVGSEEGDIGRDWHQTSRVKRTNERAQSSSSGSLSVCWGNSKDMVDDVDHTAGEVYVLNVLLVNALHLQIG
jgi:hypothetical protein